MKIIRSVLWIAVIVALALFTAFNWTSVDILIWESLVLETKLPVLILAAFLLGYGPMWLTHRTSVWRLKRRIASLEASQRSLIASQSPATPDAQPVRPSGPVSTAAPAGSATAPLAGEDDRT